MRRRRGTGSIPRQRKNGLWVGQVSLGTRPDGTRDRRSFSSPRRGDVEFWMRETLRRYDRGEDVDERTTVAAYLDDWLAEVTPTVLPTTARGYRIHVEKWIAPTIGYERLARLDARDVRRVTAAVLAAGRSPRTAQSVLITLRMALGAAVRDGLIERNEATGVKPPRSREHHVSATSPEQARAILDAFDGTTWGPLVTVALGTGMRLGELLALRWADVSAGRIRVTGSIRPVPRAEGRGYELQRLEPKTKRSYRTLEPGAFVFAALDEQRRSQTTLTPYVFTTRDGKWLDPRNVTKAFQAGLAANGLPRMRFHDLRHAYATVSLAAGVPLRVIQEALGHTSIALTAAVYAHVLPSLRQDAGTRLDKELFG